LYKRFAYALLACLILLSCGVIGQNEGAKWNFGNKAALDFMTNPPTIVLTSSLNTSEGCSGIADANGNLLFYTDGSTIWDAQNNVMPGGTNLGGNASTTQAAVVVKQPGSNNLYLVFSMGVCSGNFRYSIVDMSLNGGLGSVISPSVLITGPCYEKMTSVRHCNGVDTWVLVQESITGNFKAYLVTALGVNLVPIVSGPIVAVPAGACIGYMKFSPNGRKLGVCYWSAPNFGFDLYDFDASTGFVSNGVNLLNNLGAYGCEFSPDGTKFYGTSLNAAFFYQWDMCAGNNAAIIASQYTTACVSGGGMQLAINGKIYITHFGQTFLGVIDNPNNSGPAINYANNGQSVAPKLCTLGLPNFITSGFKTPTPPFTHTVSMLYGCQTASFNAPPIIQNFSVVGCVASGYSLNGVTWNFGDPGSGAANTSTLMNPSHAFSSLGTFITSLIVNWSCGGGTDTIKQAVIISQPCLTVNSTSITCANLGSATVSASGGLGPYSYTWMPSGQTGPAATGLSPGSYTVTVFDQGNNFTYTANTVFTSLVPLTATVVNSSSITCNGASTGSAQAINVAGGSGTQSYFWTNGVMTSTLVNPSNLTAGVWTYTITDALTGCMASNAFIINQPPALVINLSSNTPSVCAGGSVALTATVSGGTPKNPSPAYSYTWTGGPSTSSYVPVENISGLHVYTLTASDFYNCTISNSIAINVIANPTLVVLNASICPLQSATLAVAGANNYSWNAVPGSYTFAVNPLVNTSYAVTGENQGCFASATASITLKPVPIPTTSANSPLCQGNTLIFSVSNGQAYSWTGPAGFTSTAQSNTITSVQLNQGGVYNVTLTAANGCTASTSRFVNVKPLPLVSITPGNTSICLNTTSVALVSGGNAVQHTWTPVTGLSAGNTPTVGANPPVTTIYTLTGSLNGCTASAVSTVNVLSPPNLTVSLSSPSLCAQALNGSPASIVLSGSGAANYTLSTPLHIGNSNPSGPSSSLGMLPPFLQTGPATATLFGSNGVCTVSSTVVFTVIPNPTVSISSPTPVICAGQSFTYTSSGADSYVWSSATPGQTLYTTGNVAVANPSINSVFSVMGGSLGCNSALQSSTITVDPLPSFSVYPGLATICMGSSVPLIINGTGTSFNWAPSSGLSAVTGSSVLASPTSLQTYTVSGSLNTCTSTAMITVAVMPAPVAVIATPAASVCLNTSILMSGSGGLGYVWAGPQGFFTSGPNLELKAGSTAYSGNYTLTVTDQNGCKGSAVQHITVLGLPSGAIDTKGLQGCAPFMASSGFTMSPVCAPAMNLSWSVNGQQYSGSSFKYFVIEPGTYPVLGKVTDVNGCADTFTALIQGYAKPQADFYFSPDQPAEGLDPVLFTDASLDAVSFDWFFGSNHQKSEQRNPEFVFDQAGTYPVALVVSNAMGCSDTIIKPVVIVSDFAVYVPNAFTPNGDSDNEIFMAVTRGVTQFSLVIFNRWGQQLFESSAAEAGWDGTFKGQPCKEDVYTWKIMVKGNSGTEKRLNGHVTLYR
jgi:gliding motility-associated-like protein